MDGQLVPADYSALSPWSANLFENHAAVQFNHRVLAIATLAGALALWAASLNTPTTAPMASTARRVMALLALVAALQVALGISALLLVVPVWLGALHQAGALTLLTVAICAQHGLRRAGL